MTDAAGLTTYGYTETTATSENITAQGLLPGLTLLYPQAQGRRQGFTATLGSDTVSSMSYGYDPRGRLANVAAPGIGAGGFSVEFGYVPNSDLPETTLSKVNSANVLTGTRGYDLADRLTSVSYSRPGNQVITSHGYILDAADRRTRAERGDGTAWVYGYNSRDEVTSAVKRLPGEELLAGWQQAFEYDSIGNRNWTQEGGDANGANLRQIDYTSNALNQSTEITRPGVVDVLGRAPTAVAVTVNEGAVSRQGEFWRKEIGGLTNASAAIWQPVSVTAVDPGAGPNGADLPARRSGHQFLAPSLETPAYDLDGNLVSDSRWIYTWNGENQLIEMATAAPALAAGVPRVRYRYVYDSRSRRIGRTVENWDADTQVWVVEKSERYVYDEWNVVGVVDATGATVQRYVWGNDLSGSAQGAGGVGGLLAAADAASGRSWCYAYDGNGNVSAVVDLADGTKVGRYEYDAFGRTIASWGDEVLAGLNVYRFSTKPLEGTGLYYYGYRWYEAENGRWLGRDPIGERGGVNLYGFVGNDGLNGIDRIGLESVNPDRLISSYLKIGSIDAYEKMWSEYFKIVSTETAKQNPTDMPISTNKLNEWGGFVCAKCNGDNTYSIKKSRITSGGLRDWNPKENEMICGNGWFPVAIFHSHPGNLGLGDKDLGFLKNKIWNTIGISTVFSPGALVLGIEEIPNPNSKKPFMIKYAKPENAAFDLNLYTGESEYVRLNITFTPADGIPNSLTLDRNGVVTPSGQERFGCCDPNAHQRMSLREKTDLFRSSYKY